MLYDYYIEMFAKIDKFHFNSEVAMKNYCTRLSNLDYQVISITNSNIRKKYKEKTLRNRNNIVFGYFGDRVGFKGYWLMLEAFDDIFKTNNNFLLKIFTGGQQDRDYIEVNDPFRSEELYNVLDAIDILVVPSIWKETFGFVVLEAMSRGVPVLTTTYVGASQIIPRDSGIVVEPTKEALRSALSSIIENPELVIEMNRNLKSFAVKSNGKTCKRNRRIL